MTLIDFHAHFMNCKVGRVFPMVVVSILPHAEFGPNDHREDAPHFITELDVNGESPKTLQ